jgi:CRISPR-associated endonuclease/helicase Cas3
MEAGMSDWAGERFAEFFEALWGRPPFAWQADLAQRVLAAADTQPSSWPQAIALATASGKTACMDVAVYALAAHSARVCGTPGLRMPRRIFFVVDRRVIVDEAHERALQIAAKLREAGSGILKEAADRLRHLAGGELPLAVQKLRGGQPRLDDWAATPLQPTIVSSTVDQVGSRLLFRAYGTLPGMWPVHAALVGNDALILLDEAHCAQPMLQTLRAVQRYRGWAAQPLPTALEVAVLSATPPADIDPAQVFHDTSSQRRDATHVLGRRQLASKLARLDIAAKAKGRNATQRRGAMAAELARHAFELANAWPRGDAGEPAVVVFCNRVDTARRVCALLASDRAQVRLLTGRMRPIDKDDFVVDALQALTTARAGDRRLQRPTFVVATQTLEVGADLDFDLLVTECASLDALRQRFGRLNRSGRAIAAKAVIVTAAQDLEPGSDDPVYGAALHRSWAWLDEQARANGGDVVDFGIAALERLLPVGEALAALNAPAPRAPVLLPAHVDLLAQTAPVPEPTPDVGIFLHGPSGGLADVQVCWRADLDAAATEEAWIDALLHCPPSSPECLAVPWLQARRWLDNLPAPQGPDIEGADDEDEPPRDDTAAVPRTALRWRGRDRSDTQRLTGGSDLRPGDLLVLPVSAGGFDELGTLGATPVADWGDRAHAAMRRDAVLRLNAGVVAQWPGGPARAPLDALLGPGAMLAWQEDAGAFAEALRAALRDWLPALEDPRWDWLHGMVEQAAGLRRLSQSLLPHPCGGWIVLLRRELRTGSRHGAAAAAAFFGDEDDAASSGHYRSLLIEPQADGHSHLSGVGALARHYAGRCGLPPELAEVVGCSGDGHDLGKADPRFQSWLRNGVPWVAGPLLAKSADMPQGQTANRLARERAGYPSGGRHELLSVRLLESQTEALPSDAGLRDLLLHLVESHHGHCRPFAPVVADEMPLDVSAQFRELTLSTRSDTGLDRIDAGPADRYWRLTRRYGWWGLAWLECLLRLADHRRSEVEQQRSRGVPA